VVPEYVAQDEHGALASGQNLQRGHERQRDGFGLFVARLRAERHLARTLQEDVGIRLEPRDLAEAGRLSRLNLGDDVPLAGRAGWPSAAP
jgi:hypothetical protein